MDSLCRKCEHPVDVGSSDKMPGRAQHVSANDASVVDLPLDLRIRKSNSALSDSPPRCSVILCLNGAESCYDFGRRRQRWRYEALVDQALSCDVWYGHGSIIVYVVAGIGASIRIASHLSLTPVRCLVPDLSHKQPRPTESDER
jgi:hypothetical protein